MNNNTNTTTERKQNGKKKLIQRSVIVAVLTGIITLFFVFDLGQYFTLEYMKESQAGFAQYYEENKVIVIGAYMLIYIVMAALSLPGAAPAAPNPRGSHGCRATAPRGPAPRAGATRCRARLQVRVR